MYKYAGLRAVIRQMADGKFKQASWRNKQVTGRKLGDCSSVYFSNSYKIIIGNILQATILTIFFTGSITWCNPRYCILLDWYQNNGYLDNVEEE